MGGTSLQYRTFVVLLVIVTLAFFWVISPYFAAILWGAALAISFMPIHKRIANRMPNHRSLSAIISLLICLVSVVVPIFLLMGALFKEGVSLYKKIDAGHWNAAEVLSQAIDALPPSLHAGLDYFGISNLLELKEHFSSAALQGSKYLAGQAVFIGQNTFQFLIGLAIMLYLLFFLFRDGTRLAERIHFVIPLDPHHKDLLILKFVTVVRATIKGNVVIAALQGLLGGIMLWILGIENSLLWGVLMAFLSLLPAVGASLVWLPVAIYFLATGAIWSGVILLAFGALVISMIDNILRPVLVGKDTQMPDYMVLISTLGGLAVFGLNGFVVGPLVAALFMSVWDLFPEAIRSIRSE